MGEKRMVYVCVYVCVCCHGNAQSLSYNYMGKNGSRTFTPRYTLSPFPPRLATISLPTPFFPRFVRLRFLSPTFPIAVAASLLLLLPSSSPSSMRSSFLSSTALSRPRSPAAPSPPPLPPPRPTRVLHLLHLLLLLRLLLLIRLHLAVSSRRGTYFARLGNIMLAPYRGDCVTILNSL